jgi:uncharacterized protein HemX
MNRQTGISTAGLALVLVLLAAAGGGYFGWQQHQELGRTRADLATTRTGLDKASADARAAKADAATARKELEEQKAALQQARSDADTAKVFLESEKAHSLRLQADLKLAREQMAYLQARSNATRFDSPSPVAPPKPMVIRAAPAGIQAIQAQPAPAPAGATPRR